MCTTLLELELVTPPPNSELVSLTLWCCAVVGIVTGRCVLSQQQRWNNGDKKARNRFPGGLSNFHLFHLPLQVLNTHKSGLKSNSTKATMGIMSDLKFIYRDLRYHPDKKKVTKTHLYHLEPISLLSQSLKFYYSGNKAAAKSAQKCRLQCCQV